MTENPVAQVNVNTGSLKELMSISGIGEGLAQRIVDARPYAVLDDLARVQGISDRSVARWAPLLTVEGTEDVLPVIEGEAIEEPVDEVVDAVIEEVIDSEDEPEAELVEPIVFDEVAEEDVPPAADVVEEDLIPEPIPEAVDDAQPAQAAAEAKPKATKEKPVKPAGSKKPLERGDIFLLGGAVGVLSVLLAVVLTLGILALVNGGLEYVSPWALSQTERQMETLGSEMDVLVQDIDALETRMDALETLGGRVADLESEADALREESARIQSEMDGLQEAVAEVSQEVYTLKEQFDVVERFLGGMQSLLNELLPETAAPEPAAE